MTTVKHRTYTCAHCGHPPWAHPYNEPCNRCTTCGTKTTAWPCCPNYQPCTCTTYTRSTCAQHPPDMAK